MLKANMFRLFSTCTVCTVCYVLMYICAHFSLSANTKNIYAFLGESIILVGAVSNEVKNVSICLKNTHTRAIFLSHFALIKFTIGNKK